MKSFWIAALLALLGLPALATAQGNGPSPGHSNAFGAPLEFWMAAYWRWALGASPSDHLGHVKFLPIPEGSPVSGSGTFADPVVVVGSIDVVIHVGEAFALPIESWLGETYDPSTGTPDDQPLDESIFTGSNVLVALDHRALLDSRRHDLDDAYFGPHYFHPPILYDTPTDYGSIGVVFVQGLGLVHPPLSRQTHMLVVRSEIRIPDLDIGVIYRNTWTIHVVN